ncbi:SIR2-like domain-containing protein [Nitrosospira multiformis]|uniref:SIR2-like domain-containing protein n=1 Tax=Nitrosospira multiformis TaxID=1231 RepID=A0A1H8MYH2_9PROT|nr:SIR2 family protein [Nitrosospira multiformis]SEO22303.1 SIR2-like domain-containing protein [Nitrosospira multiformis]
MDYQKYQADLIADITELIKKKGCQPILFIGSGFSKRYCDTPNWAELLTELGSECPEVKQEYAYYRQSGKSDKEIGSIFAAAYKEWAWNSDKSGFPKEYFTPKCGSDIFIKYVVAQKLKKLQPGKAGTFGSEELDGEILALKEISPHAVITTNYDTLIEAIFKDYKPVIGQQVIRHSYMSIGEIFKIHGCVSDPESIVLTNEDYDKFATDKKYLSAKLFTFFVEHPLIFIGYSANDPNIKSILQEIDRMLPVESGLIDNIYILEWNSELDPNVYPSREKVIDIGNGNSIRIKSVTADSFEWVFKAFKSEAPLEKVNIKLLRSITHRVFSLVRKDAAKNTVEINFEMLEHALNNPGELAKVYGIAAINNPALLNLTHPFLPKQAASQLGSDFGWQRLNQLIEKLSEATGFDMRASDNKFHVYISPTRRYSQEGIDLLKRFKNGDNLPDLSDPSVTGVHS